LIGVVGVVETINMRFQMPNIILFSIHLFIIGTAAK